MDPKDNIHKTDEGEPMPDETTAERIARMYHDKPHQAAQAAVQQVVGNLVSELRRSYPGGLRSEDAANLIRQIANEHGYPVYI